MSVRRGLSSPVQPFTSTFAGLSIDEVMGWYDGNITQPRVVGYMKRTFIDLEQEAVDDEICTVVCMAEEPAGKLRCDFTLALHMAVLVEIGRSTEEGIIGPFKRSGVVVTKDNYEIAENRGVYLEGTEVKIDEDWKDFANW